MKPLTLQRVNNLYTYWERCVRNNNFNSFTNDLYNFIMLSSGFIAHYNKYGFIDHYKSIDNLCNDLLKYQSNNKWSNFRPGDANYDYYRQKAEIYQNLCNIIKKYTCQPEH